MYFLSHGTKPLQEDSFLRYNEACTCARGRTFARAPTTFFASLFPRLFPASFFLPLLSTPLHSTPFASCTFSPPSNGRREIHDMHCFLQEKQWGCFCANDGRRGEARPPCLSSPAAAFWKQNKRSRNHSLCGGATTVSPSPPLGRKNWSATGEFVYSIEMRGIGRVGWKRKHVRNAFSSREKEISFMNGFVNGEQRFAALIGFRIGSQLKAMNISFRGSSDFERRRRMDGEGEGTGRYREQLL